MVSPSPHLEIPTSSSDSQLSFVQQSSVACPNPELLFTKRVVVKSGFKAKTVVMEQGLGEPDPRWGVNGAGMHSILCPFFTGMGLN